MRGSRRPSKTLRVTPSMAAGLADHVWSIEEIVSLVQNQESRDVAQIPRAPLLLSIKPALDAECRSQEESQTDRR